MSSFSFADCSNNCCPFFDNSKDENCSYVDDNGEPLFHICAYYQPIKPIQPKNTKYKRSELVEQAHEKLNQIEWDLRTTDAPKPWDYHLWWLIDLEINK